jgi:hypothetical protein
MRINRSNSFNSIGASKYFINNYQIVCCAAFRFDISGKVCFDGTEYRTLRLNDGAKLIFQINKWLRGNKNGKECQFLTHRIDHHFFEYRLIANLMK